MTLYDSFPSIDAVLPSLSTLGGATNTNQQYYSALIIIRDKIIEIAGQVPPPFVRPWGQNIP